MGQLLQFQNLHRTKKSEGSTPELFERQEEEEEEEGEDNPALGDNLDSGLFADPGGDVLEEFPVLELQPVPLPSKHTSFSFGEWRRGELSDVTLWRHTMTLSPASLCVTSY